MSYGYGIYDRAGYFDSGRCSSFAELCSKVAELRAKYPGKVVLGFNHDLSEMDTNGLTEEEEEALP